MSEEIEIFVGDVNDVEARVFARYAGAAEEPVRMRGNLTGPFCEGSRTLPAHIPFRESSTTNMLEAVVPDPCTWTEELPHVYRADVEARAGERVIAAYHGTIGLRRGQRE